ncbi:hypothetical protein Tco_1185936 [Tanacetum coccineum]
MGYEKPSQKLTFYKAFFSPQWKFLIHTITQCLSSKSIAWNEFSSTMASLIICLATNQKFNLSNYIFDAMVKHLDGGPISPTQDEGVDSGIPTDSLQTPITTQPSSSRSQKKQSRRKQRKDIAVTQEETQQDDSVPTPSNDPPLSGEDSMQLSELMILCTNLQKQVLDLEKAKDAQAKEIVGLKKRGRSIEDIDKDANVSLVDDTQGRLDNEEMFDTNYLHGDEEPSEFRTLQESQPSMIKDKGKAIMIEPDVPLKRKDQVALDEDLARNLQA